MSKELECSSRALNSSSKAIFEPMRFTQSHVNQYMPFNVIIHSNILNYIYMNDYKLELMIILCFQMLM